MAEAFWRSKRVFITGHTGFKGVWLSLWLQSLGAAVSGYSRSQGSADRGRFVADIESFQGNICDAEALQRAISSSRPEIAIHLAAQPLVRRAFHDPVESYRTNVLGTAALLESVRHCDSVRGVLVITTDKCYEPRGWDWAYRETDLLGGADPYSSSKACMELVVSGFRRSYFPAALGVGLATARAGNMIGGGDWAEDRLIPDMMRSFAAGKPVTLRNPDARRPWQYVLETLRGYLLLARRLYEDAAGASGAWNFGPDPGDIRPVSWIAARLAAAWGADASWNFQPGSLPQEAQMVRLDCSKAAAMLGWRPVLSLGTALDSTVAWYRDHHSGRNLRDIYVEQLAAYRSQLPTSDVVLPSVSAAR